MRAAIRLAGGREVCFVCTLDEDGLLRTARVVARGDVTSVLALPGFAQRGEMLVHNHPSGVLEPSEADYQVAAGIHEEGVGRNFGTSSPGRRRDNSPEIAPDPGVAAIVACVAGSR